MDPVLLNSLTSFFSVCGLPEITLLVNGISGSLN